MNITERAKGRQAERIARFQRLGLPTDGEQDIMRHIVAVMSNDIERDPRARELFIKAHPGWEQTEDGTWLSPVPLNQAEIEAWEAEYSQAPIEAAGDSWEGERDDIPLAGPQRKMSRPRPWQDWGEIYISDWWEENHIPYFLGKEVQEWEWARKRGVCSKCHTYHQETKRVLGYDLCPTCAAELERK